MSKSQHSQDDPHRVERALAMANTNDYCDYMRLNWAAGARAMARRARQSHYKRHDDTNNFSCSESSHYAQLEHTDKTKAAYANRLSLSFTLSTLLLTLLLGLAQVLLVLAYNRKLNAAEEKLVQVVAANLTNESVQYGVLLQSLVFFDWSEVKKDSSELQSINEENLTVRTELQLARFRLCVELNGSHSYGSTCYHYSRNSYNWNAARLHCALIGGALATVDSAVLQEYLTSLAVSVSSDGAKSADSYWIGLHNKNESQTTCDEEAKQWIWVESQTETTYRNFSKQNSLECGGAPQEQCVMVNSGVMHSKLCSEQFYFFCIVRDEIGNGSLFSDPTQTIHYSDPT